MLHCPLSYEADAVTATVEVVSVEYAVGAPVGSISVGVGNVEIVTPALDKRAVGE